jgi:hypothetical protein
MGYRFNVCIVAFERPDVMSYFPTWIELGVSLGIVAGAMLLFIFFVEKLRVYPEADEETPVPVVPSFEPHSTRVLLPSALAAPRRHSLAFVLAASLTLAALPEDALWGARAQPTPVAAPRTVDGLIQMRDDEHGHVLEIIEADYSPPLESELVGLMLIDGNRDGRLVVFPHDWHAARIGAELGEEFGNGRSCGTCHHQSLPYARNSACGQCHRDMYSETDIFRHASHVENLGGNDGCVRCHTDSSRIKSRETATLCLDCHRGMVRSDSMINPPEEGMIGYAKGYMDAMHGLCLGCHEQKVKTEPATYSTRFSECANCHRDTDGSRLRQMKPYAPKETIASFAKQEESG